MPDATGSRATSAMRLLAQAVCLFRHLFLPVSVGRVLTRR